MREGGYHDGMKSRRLLVFAISASGVALLFGLAAIIKWLIVGAGDSGFLGLWTVVLSSANAFVAVRLLKTASGEDEGSGS